MHPAAYSNLRLVINSLRNWEVIHQNYKHCRQAWSGFLKTFMKIKSSRYQKQVSNSLRIITIQLLRKKKWSLSFLTFGFARRFFPLCHNSPYTCPKPWGNYEIRAPMQLLVILKSAAGTLSAEEKSWSSLYNHSWFLSLANKLWWQSCYLLYYCNNFTPFQQLFMDWFRKAFFHVRAGKRKNPVVASEICCFYWFWQTKMIIKYEIPGGWLEWRKMDYSPGSPYPHLAYRVLLS